MKRVIVAFISLVFVLGLTFGCTSLGDSPEKAAEEWFNAALERNIDTLTYRTCVSQQNWVHGVGTAVTLTEILSQILSNKTLNALLEDTGFLSLKQQTLDQLNVDALDFNFETTRLQGDSAWIKVTGAIHLDLISQFGPVIPVEEQWIMVKENNRWKWCGRE